MSTSTLQPTESPVTQQPIPPAAKSGDRWVEVVSHLHPKYGGLSAAVPALGQRLARANNLDISLAAFVAPGERIQPSGYDTSHITFWPASRRPWLLGRFNQDRVHKSLRSTFLDHLRGADGVHIHGLWEQSTSTAAHAARSLRIPYLISAHGMLEPWALRNKRVKKHLYAHLIERPNVAGAACLHALTRAEARHYIAFGAGSPIAIIPNGVDIPSRRDPSLFLNQFPAAQGRRIILFLGRLHPKKGLDLLLQAWATLAFRHPDALLVLAGPDSEGTQARLEALIAQHRLRENVLFTGMLREAQKWSALAAAEAFVLPSYSEGLSVGVLEALGMALPVIVTEPCNMPEVEESHAGWQIQPTLSDLTHALTELLANTPAANARIGENGAALIQSRYTWPIVAAQMAELYRWLAGGPYPQTVEFAPTGKS